AHVPCVSKVSRSRTAAPFLGMLRTLDVRGIVQIASEIDVPPSRRDDVSGSISFKALDAALLDALIRLVTLLDEPALVPRLTPLIQQPQGVSVMKAPRSSVASTTVCLALRLSGISSAYA